MSANVDLTRPCRGSHLAGWRALRFRCSDARWLASRGWAAGGPRTPLWVQVAAPYGGLPGLDASRIHRHEGDRIRCGKDQSNRSAKSTDAALASCGGAERGASGGAEVGILRHSKAAVSGRGRFAVTGRRVGLHVDAVGSTVVGARSDPPASVTPVRADPFSGRAALAHDRKARGNAPRPRGSSTGLPRHRRGHFRVRNARRAWCVLGGCRA